jgi:hypothetical protein
MIDIKDLDPIYFQDNWDDNGAKAISNLVWNEVVDIFRMLEKVYNQQRNTDIDVPCFNPCADGSVDIYWKVKEKYSLLINTDTKANVDYFGHSTIKNNKSHIKGNSTNPADIYYLGYWLATI